MESIKEKFKDINRRWKYTGQGIFSNVGGEVVILNLSTNHYYGLNETGTIIWESIEDEPNIQDLIDKVMAEYEIDKEACLNDVQSILQQLESLDLITEIVES